MKLLKYASLKDPLLWQSCLDIICRTQRPVPSWNQQRMLLNQLKRARQLTVSNLQIIPLLKDRIQDSDFTETLMKKLGRTPEAMVYAKELHTGQRLLGFASYRKADVKAEGFASPRDYNIYCFLDPLCWMRPRINFFGITSEIRTMALWQSAKLRREKGFRIVSETG